MKTGLPSSYMFLLLGSFVSKIGDSIYTFAIPWISYEITKSATIMGSLYATSVLPIVALGPFIGSLVDKFSKKNLMIIADVLRVILISMVPILHAYNFIEIWHLYAISFLVTIISLMFDVSTVAIIPEIAGDQLTKANSSMQLITQLSGFIGPLVAGVLISSIGGYSTLWVDVISFAGTIVTVWQLLPVDAGMKEYENVNIFTSMTEGFKWLIRDKLQLGFSLQAMIGNFGYSTAFAVLIFYLRTSIHLNAEMIGINLALLSIGGLFGTIMIIPIERKFGRSNSIPLLLSIGFLGYLVAMLPFFWFDSGLGFGIVSFCNVSWNIIITTIRQECVPKVMLGRVLSVSRVLTRLGMPLGAMVGGLVLANGNAPEVFLIAAISKFIEILIAFFWIKPRLSKKPKRKSFE
ncbi:MFS transporter [Metabacillus sp. RGM 3146]|uniref:MFS transporter n=1 Tax=Metabacillus sp. RGM 3146 TaxID=3401092 RepID=UPI003B9A5E55